MLGFKHFEEEAHEAENDPNEPKIVEKSHVLRDIDSIETPRGGTPPANHLWRICDRGLVSAGVPGVLGVLGALGVFGYEATTSRKRIPMARQGLGHFSASNVKPVGGQVCAT